MVISSLVVETTPERTDEVARELSGRAGVEVHEASSPSRPRRWTTRTASQAASSASRA